MNPIRLEAKRFLYSLWMLPATVMVMAGLIWFVYRTGVYPRQQEPTVCLALLLSTVEYHILLYCVLAAAIMGVDVNSGIPRLETLAGGSPLRFLQRKAILYIIAVLICELLYIAVPLLMWGVSPGPLWRLLPARLFLYLGIGMPFFMLQTVLPSLQAMLIGDAAAAILWIRLFDDDMNTWYLAVLGQQALPVRWFLLAVLSIVISLSVSFAVFKLSTSKHR